jgi:predicted metal-dependent hydrolase
MDSIPNQYTIARRRVKNARVSVNHELQIKIIIPLWYREKDLQQLLTEKQNWIQKQLYHFSKANEDRIKLAPDEILYLGEIIKPEFYPGNKIYLQKWYLERAHNLFAARIQELSAMHGFIYNKLSIRNQKTRWGSCSKKKNISLNWKLIKAQICVIDYLILHELTHTIFFDHSKAFWQKVAKICPQYKEASAWLKKYGRYL